jgi:probable phosphoglycerate mutase
VTHDYQRPFTLPAGATELILVRHGASQAGEAGKAFGLVGGHSDPPLTAHGHEQSRALADRLGGARVAALFISPLRRTAQTAGPLAERLGLEPTVIDEMREVHLGAWETDGGLSGGGPEREALRRRVLDEESWSLIPGGEGAEAFASRVRGALEQVAATTGPDRLGVAVTHGGVIAEICHQITGSRPFAFFATENCSITRVICLDEGRWQLQTFNDTSHLADLS